MSVMSRRLERAEAALAEQYGSLSPEDRFQLIVAAGARGDMAEQGRLIGAGGCITLSMSDHSPYGHALSEVSLMMFVEVLNSAANYFELFWRADAAEDDAAGATRESGGGPEDGTSCDDGATGGADVDTAPDPEGECRPLAERLYDLALAEGFMLRVKVDGWRQFCQRIGVAPFATWEVLPGYDRLERALRLAEQAAFSAEGMARWLSRLYPEGEPEAPELPAPPFSVEATAAGLERMFRQQVAHWSGE